MDEHFDAVVVGSGAGGGVVAGELGLRGRRVLLLEVGDHHTAAEFVRFEARANHDLWWPFSEAAAAAPGGDSVTLFRGRCVGGGTTINTKVGLRAGPEDYEKWHAATGLVNGRGAPFGEADLRPHYERVERVLGVRERSDWQRCVRTVEPGFAALGASLEPVMSYTDANCMLCGSCLQGCPTNAGKSTLNTYIHQAWATGRLDLRPGCEVRRILVERTGGALQATGVEYVDPEGGVRRVGAGVVVAAAGTLGTPGLLIRSAVPELAGGTPSSGLIGHHLGFHPSRLVFGLFDEIQDAHRIYPIPAHCMDFRRDADGGFIVEAATIMDPIAFASSVCDERGEPMWGQALVDVVRDYRRWVGILVMVNDENTGRAWVDGAGNDRYTADFNARERERIERSFGFARRVLEAAGASRVLATRLFTTHVQGSCRMGGDPSRSVVDGDCQSHDVRRLYVGDGSVVPRTLSVNPSLTIMALASRLAGHLDTDAHGYLGPSPAAVAADG
jgi:choline dehydrogenase-like flavoprotein